MVMEWKLCLFSIIYIVVIIDLAMPINSDILKDPNYSPDYYYSTFDNNNLKQTFLDRRRQNRITAKRVQLLDQYLSNNSVFVDGIMHQKIDKTHKKIKDVNEIEKAFRNLIRMKGVILIYKRDQFWRTWRKVKYPDGDKIVCYRCQTSANCTSCQNGGYWVIEENPPCPFEIVSVISNEEACVINTTNSTTNIEQDCPSIVPFIEITRICDNPIYTQWRVQKDYNKEVSERFPAVFCSGREHCEFSTFYLITRNYVSFQIINSTNHILYSRVMKNDKINYACVDDCGKIDSKTKTPSKTDSPLIIDLINNKNKRDDKTQNEGSTVFYSTTPSTGKVVSHKLISEKPNHATNAIELVFNFQEKPKKHHHDKKHPSCSSLKHYNMENDMSDEI